MQKLLTLLRGLKKLLSHFLLTFDVILIMIANCGLSLSEVLIGSGLWALILHLVVILLQKLILEEGSVVYFRDSFGNLFDGVIWKVIPESDSSTSICVRFIDSVPGGVFIE